MRLVRYGEKGLEKPGLIDAEGHIRDVSSVVRDISGEVLSDVGLALLRALDPEKLPLVAGSPRLGPCVGDTGKVIGVAINYKLHGEETGLGQPTEPSIFLKATSAICGPHDDLLLPKGSQKTDWEVELGVVIGRRAQNISEAEAINHIAGYCVVDDVSERSFQLERGGQQHSKGKSADTFCPLGPWLVTRDEAPDPQNLKLWTKVGSAPGLGGKLLAAVGVGGNGMELMQNGTTADMIFSVVKLVSYLSEFMTLLPGDVIATGTPDGVGKGRKPPRYLRSGEVVELGIEGLGEQRHRVV
jgi:2-keto-4-pentenoate hydratase/2-oxohepta-3-ene-1,7-dioic acid hydratase in catechol pathway